MTIAMLYNVEDAARSNFEGKTSKLDWYDTLGEMEIQQYESFDAEESLQTWKTAFEQLGAPLSFLFSGELRAEPDGRGDPDVVFIGNTMVAAIAKELEDKSQHFFQQLFNEVEFYYSPDIWLFEPMLDFLKKASSSDQGVIILWGN